MSYDLCVFWLEKAVSTEAALELLDGEECVECSPQALGDFLGAVLADFPALEEAEESPWAGTPCLDGNRIFVALTYSAAQEFTEYLLQLAQRYELALLDYQRPLLFLPPKFSEGEKGRVVCPCLPIDMAASGQLLEDLLPLVVGAEEPFVVLERAPHFYMQCYWWPEGFDLEYRDGGPEAHFASTEKLSLAEVLQALLEYMDGACGWKARHRFELMEFE